MQTRGILDMVGCNRIRERRRHTFALCVIYNLFIIHHRQMELTISIGELLMPAVEESTPGAVMTSLPTVEGKTSPLVAGYVAHEFNNLFAGLNLRISAAKMSLEEDSGAIVHLDRAIEEIDRGRDTVLMLEAFCNTQPPEWERVPVRDLAARLDSSGVYSDVSLYGISPTLSPGIKGEMNALVRAFRFLALHMSRSRRFPGVRASITEGRMAEGNAFSLSGGNYIRIAVERRDNPDLADDSEVPVTLASLHANTGAGLPIAACHAVISGHNGVLATIHRDGQIAGFSAYLPVIRQTHGEETVIAEPVRGQTGRILLMDDEDSIRTIAELLFSKLGYDITTVSDGAEAVKAYQSAKAKGVPYRVVVMDLTVPWGMGGREAIARIREIDPEVRAIVSSGYSSDPVMARYRDYGFRAAVEKPYRLETLVEAVRSLL